MTLPAEYTPEHLEFAYGEREPQAIEEVDETEMSIETPSPLGNVTMRMVTRRTTRYR